jgi:hypothetical protein
MALVVAKKIPESTAGYLSGYVAKLQQFPHDQKHNKSSIGIDRG